MKTLWNPGAQVPDEVSAKGLLSLSAQILKVFGNTVEQWPKSVARKRLSLHVRTCHR